MDGKKRISDIMDRKLVAVSRTTPIRIAVRLVRTSGVSLLPVLDDGKLVGVVGEEELLDYLSKHGEGGQDESVMSVARKPVFVESGESIADTIQKVIDGSLVRIPIVDSARSMRCIGIVSATELLKEASK